jgi:hypothetical protein
MGLMRRRHEVTNHLLEPGAFDRIAIVLTHLRPPNMRKRPPKPPERRSVPRYKRDKDKKQQSTGEIKTIDIDASRLSPDIPVNVKIAIADSIMAYATMEGAAERLIWEVTGLSYDDGKLLTRIDASNKFDILRKAIEQHGLIVFRNRRTTLDMWAAIKQLMPARNLIVHGVWAMLDKSIPITVSYRLPSDHGRVEGESFQLERLEAIVAQCLRVKKSFDNLSERVLALRATLPAQHHRD